MRAMVIDSSENAEMQVHVPSVPNLMRHPIQVNCSNRFASLQTDEDKIEQEQSRATLREEASKNWLDEAASG